MQVAQVTTTTRPVPPLEHLTKDLFPRGGPEEMAWGFFKALGAWSVEHWVLSTCVVLGVLGWMAWVTFRRAVWGK